MDNTVTCWKPFVRPNETTTWFLISPLGGGGKVGVGSREGEYDGVKSNPKFQRKIFVR